MWLLLILLISTFDGGCSTNAAELLLNNKDVRVINIGIFVAAYYLVSIGLSLIMQKRVYKHGYKRYFLLCSAVISISMVLIVVVNTQWLLGLAFIVVESTLWTLWSLTQSYVTDYKGNASGYRRLQIILKIGNMGGSIFFIIIMAFGIKYKYEAVLLVVGVLYVIYFMVMNFKMKNIIPARAEESNIGYFKMMKDKLVSLYSRYYFISAVQHSLMASLLSIWVTQIVKLSEIYIGIIDLVVFLVGLISVWVSMRGINDKVEKAWYIVWGLGLVVSCVSNHIFGIVVYMIACSIYSMTSITIESKVHERYENGKSALLTGIQTCCEMAGYATGGLITGIILEYADDKLLIVTAVIGIIVIIFLFKLKNSLFWRC